MDNTSYRTRPVKPADLPKLIEIFSLSFFDGPLYKYIVPNPQKRRELLPKIMKKVIKLKYKYREGYVIENKDGEVAGGVFWYPKEATKPGYPFKDVLKSGLFFFPLKLPLNKIPEFLKFDVLEMKTFQSAMDAKKRILDYIAIHPEHQGRGLGSLLVNTVFKSEINPSEEFFVFTGDSRTINFYQRNGFKLQSEFHLFDGKVTFYDFKYPG